MGAIQNSINSMLGAVAGAATAVKIKKGVAKAEVAADKISNASDAITNDANDSYNEFLKENAPKDIELLKRDVEVSDEIFKKKEEIRDLRTKLKTLYSGGRQSRLIRHNIKIAKSTIKNLEYEQKSITFQRSLLDDKFKEIANLGGKK